MPDILLTTLNARYAHAAFGLRYLLANLGPLRHRAALLEFDINQRPLDIAEQIVALNPRIVGLGVYIWNAAAALELVSLLKRIRPDMILILGGPEVSHETDRQPICSLADYVITGEADLAFRDLCLQLLHNTDPAPDTAAAPDSTAAPRDRLRLATPPRGDRIIAAPLPEFTDLALPYDLYTDEDIARRVIYVEASRGCPFKCEFCLSSLDVPVRNAPLDDFLAHLQRLLDRGARRFKFVDRTFNLNLNTSRAILQFFLDRHTPDLFLHFEMIPDRLPAALRELIARFPPGALQFEVGIQTFNEAVAARISRRQDNARLEDNFRFLRQHTGVYIHADLIVGLPGEDLDSFAAGFDRLVALGPHEIQVGILKRLRGTPIARHDAEWRMVYSPHPPYEILCTSAMDFATLQRLRRLARYWDLVANSGRFATTAPLLWSPPASASSPGIPGEGWGGGSPSDSPPPQPTPPPEHAEGHSIDTPHAPHPTPHGASPFHAFLAFSDWLFDQQHRRSNPIAQHKLAEHLFRYLTEVRSHDPTLVAEALADDYRRSGSRDFPDLLRPYLKPPNPRPAPRPLPPRQARRH